MEPWTVFIVDDDPIVLKLLHNRFSRKEGTRPITAETGTAALALLEKERPNVIILDYLLPDTDGVALCKVIKANPLFEATPIYFFTSFQDFGFAASVEAAGALGVISKNDLADLMTAVYKLRDKAQAKKPV